MRPLTIPTSSPAETARIAEAFAPCLRNGDVLILSGELAAGKTYFVQNLVRALGSTDIAVSPTFAIANFYETCVGPFIHVDAYRLSGMKEYADLGLDEFAESAILAIEWGDRLVDAFADYILIEFRFSAADEEARVLVVSFIGDRWALDQTDFENFQALAR
jgi:tRNA threonylcarbamoyladenosine biosynthesis protein TsaE